MRQSLISVLGLVVGMFFLHQQQRMVLVDYEHMLHAEYQMMAEGVALEIMESIAAKPFDAATADPDYQPSDFDADDMAPWPFETGKAFDAATALEDYHEITTHTVSYDIGGTTIDFLVDMNVTYVDDNRTFTTNQTDTKEVIVSVRHARYKDALVELPRAFSAFSY